MAILGQDSHTTDSLAIAVVADSADGLSTPTDVEFHPNATNQMWVTSQDNDTMVIVFDPGEANQTSVQRSGFGSVHFMPKPSALAFGQPGFLATIHEQDQITQPSTPADFMGPSLWTDDIRSFDGGHDSHFDMLHNSPNGVGIAWETGNAYWVFDGFHGSLTRYDFVSDHGPGGTDHSDGVIARYVEGEVSYVPGVVSHLEVDRVRNVLYVADTGNGRVARLDMAIGTRGRNLNPNYDGCQQYQMTGATLTTLVDGASVGLEKPSGLVLRDDVVYVSDHATSKIFAFDLEGAVLDWLDLSPMIEMGGIAGINFDGYGRLYVVDSKAHRVLQISVPQD